MKGGREGLGFIVRERGRGGGGGGGGRAIRKKELTINRKRWILGGSPIFGSASFLVRVRAGA